MRQILRTVASHEDYQQIWYYIALDNVEAANRVLRSFDETLVLLSENPHAGRRRPLLHRDARSFPVGAYVLFYQPCAEGIQLLRVLHGARKLWRKMFDG